MVLRWQSHCLSPRRFWYQNLHSGPSKQLFWAPILINSSYMAWPDHFSMDFPGGPLPHIDDVAFNSYLTSTIERQISKSFLLVDLVLGQRLTQGTELLIWWTSGIILSSSSDMLQGRWNDGLTVIIPSDLMPWNTLQKVDLTESWIVWTAASRPITTRASYLLARSNSFFWCLEVHI